MTNQQLYLAIGLPIFVFLIGFTTTILVGFWSTKELRADLKELRADLKDLRNEMRDDIKGLRLQIELAMGKMSEMDGRIGLLEYRKGGGPR